MLQSSGKGNALVKESFYARKAFFIDSGVGTSLVSEKGRNATKQIWTLVQKFRRCKEQERRHISNKIQKGEAAKGV